MEGWAVWVTGLPSSGKSVITRLLLERLKELGVWAQVLESDELRKVITPLPNYSEEERDYFYTVMVYVGKLLTQNGVNVIFDATANRRRYREAARSEIPRFIEVYVKCSLEVCMKRDVKGIYRKALRGDASNVPGVQSLYEEPLNPEAVVESDKLSPEECTRRVLEVLTRYGFIKGG